MKYILWRHSTYDDSTKISKTTKVICLQCIFPYYLCDNEKKYIASQTQSELRNRLVADEHKTKDAINIIDDCQKKVQLFIVHIAWCSNQNNTIEEFHQ